MRSLNICVDIDGTLTDPYYWIEETEKYFGIKIREEDVTQYEIHKILNIPKEDYIMFYEQYGEKIHKEAKLRENVKEVMEKLNLFHNLYYVTAREQKLETITKEWIDLHQLPCDDLYLLGSHYKVPKALDLRCDIFLEDNYDNALQLSSSGFTVLLLDTNYNRLPLPKGVKRVYDWREIYNEIQELAIGKIA